MRGLPLCILCKMVLSFVGGQALCRKNEGTFCSNCQLPTELLDDGTHQPAYHPVELLLSGLIYMLPVAAWLHTLKWKVEGHVA